MLGRIHDSKFDPGNIKMKGIPHASRATHKREAN